MEFIVFTLSSGNRSDLTRAIFLLSGGHMGGEKRAFLSLNLQVPSRLPNDTKFNPRTLS
jgi:hypothetical protein